jgi:hypothetical protein
MVSLWHNVAKMGSPVTECDRGALPTTYYPWLIAFKLTTIYTKRHQYGP